MMNITTQREIHNTNTFEERWKIKTNTNKFKVIKLGHRTGPHLIVENQRKEFSNSGKALGLAISTQGYNANTTERTNRANAALKTLYRFKDMNTKIKTHLVKTLILPIIDYPPIPTHALSNKQISKLQKIQNKSLRFATNQRYPYTLNTQEIHENTQTLPVNIRLHNQALKIWNKIETLDIPIFHELIENTENIQNWNKNFPSSLTALRNIPQPKFH